MIFKKVLPFILCAAVVSGCAIGPNYKRPDLDLTAETQTGEDYSVFQNYKWWEMFQDETLNNLETQALQFNHDLRQAIARVDQARAGVVSARADQLPMIGLQAGSGRAGNYYGSAQTPSTGTIVAAFELDLWGKYRRLSEAAQAQLLSTTAAKDTGGKNLCGYFKKKFHTELQSKLKSLMSKKNWLKLPLQSFVKRKIIRE